MDLIAFLRHRLDEDEAAARQFDGYDPSRPTDLQKALGMTPSAPAIWELEASAEYVTVYIDPARVLAEVDAKRRLIADVLDYEAMIDGEWGCCHEPSEIAAGLCRDRPPNDVAALRLLALPYADHEEFDDAWRL